MSRQAWLVSRSQRLSRLTRKISNKKNKLIRSLMKTIITKAWLERALHNSRLRQTIKMMQVNRRKYKTWSLWMDRMMELRT